MVNAQTRSKAEVDPDFMPFPQQFHGDQNATSDGETDSKSSSFESLKNRALILQFVKSPMSVNPCMSKQTNIYLQGEDRLFLDLVEGQGRRRKPKPLAAASSNSSNNSRTMSESSALSDLAAVVPSTSSDHSDVNSDNDGKMSLLS